jgi:hypothetical protein
MSWLAAGCLDRPQLTLWIGIGLTLAIGAAAGFRFLHALHGELRKLGVLRPTPRVAKPSQPKAARESLPRHPIRSAPMSHAAQGSTSRVPSPGVHVL